MRSQENPAEEVTLDSRERRRAGHSFGASSGGPTRRQLVFEEAPLIDTGDTAFVLISAALVMVMTPGLAFFYGGLGDW